MSDLQPDTSTSISRRESLKRAAGALALGLGAPVAALAATGESPSRTSVIGFYKVPDGRTSTSEEITGRSEGKDDDLVYEIEIPDEIAQTLTQPGYICCMKIPQPPAPYPAVFEVRRLPQRERRG